MMLHTIVRTLLAGTLALLLAACGGAEPAVTEVAEDIGPLTADPTVAVVDNGFEPAEIVIEAGTAVTWQWQGTSEHDVVGPGFQSDLQSSGTFTHTFDEPGTYTYVCNPHGGMTGTVHVLPAAS